ncbi:MAG: rhodanese-like domain-containing protein [Candidatus Kapabacteria bacterium]|nr:rhodanese-like domain-containing protein [Candidatus Kapabacteria bacterium]
MMHYLMKIIPAIILGAILVTSTACGQTRKNINVNEAKVMIDKGGVVVVDVRTPDEFNGGHLKNAKSMNVNDVKFEANIQALDKNKPVVVYCAVGGRSARAADIMAQKGFKNVYNVSGGYNAWSSAGLPTTMK